MEPERLTSVSRQEEGTEGLRESYDRATEAPSPGPTEQHGSIRKTKKPGPYTPQGCIPRLYTGWKELDTPHGQSGPLGPWQRTAWAVVKGADAP